MRLTFLLVISALSSFNHISHAFPLKPQAPPRQPAVRRRVAYSVVAVDGGSAATPPAPPIPNTLTLVQTLDSIQTVTTPASSTPPSIETVVATKIVSELEPAKTVDIFVTQEVTKSPSPTTIPSYIIVDPVGASTSSSASPLTSQTFTNFPSVSCVTSFSTSTLALSSTSTWPSIPTSFMLVASSDRTSEAAHPAEAKHPEAKGPVAAASIPSSPPPPCPAVTSSSTLPTASKKTYDDGMWHTSYPSWNATSTVLSSASATAVRTGKAQTLWKKG